MKTNESRPSLRASQVAMTEQRIMEGLAEVLAGQGEVTYRAVAHASQVQERTIYRHYPSRDDLLAAFWEWLNERLEMPPSATSLEALLAQIPQVFAAFESHEPLVRAMLHDAQGRRTRVGHAEERRAEFMGALAGVLPDVPAEDHEKLLATVQLLFSAVAWEAMKDYWGFDGERAAEASAWAIRLLTAGAIIRDDRRLRAQARLFSNSEPGELP